MAGKGDKKRKEQKYSEKSERNKREERKIRWRNVNVCYEREKFFDSYLYTQVSVKVIK